MINYAWLPITNYCRLLSRIASKPKHDKKRLGYDSYLFLIIPVSGFALGTWQLKRLKWKLGLIKELNELSKADPLNLNEILEHGEFNSLKEYNHIKASGHFIPGKYLFCGPKIFINPKQQDDHSSYKHSSLIGPSRNVGYHMIQAFFLKDLKKSILVNRGWVPKEYLSYNSDTQTPVEEITISGLIRFSQKDFKGKSKTTISLDDFDKKIKQEIWVWRDIDKMSQSLDCINVFIDQDFEDNSNGKNKFVYPVGGQTKVTLRNQHLSYAITWYGLSFFTGLLWYTRYLK